MQSNKKDLLDTLTCSAKELQQNIDTYCCLLTSLLEKQIDDRGLQRLLALCPKGSRERELEKAIKETINELEESRKAFKSKKLEILRKKLTKVLFESK
jgi:hypothetical protein